MKPISEDCIEVYTRPELYAASIWLHGLGTGGSDMDALVTSMSRCREIGLHHIAPNAPICSITVNDGMPCRAWFDVLGEPDKDGVDEAGLLQSCQRIHQLLDEEVARGIAAEHILLGGFSQGGALALYAGLTYPKRLAGIVALATEIVSVGQLIDQRSEANQDTPILMLHGTEDTVVPYQLAYQGYQQIQAAGLSAMWQSFPVAHQVSADMVRTVDTWAYPLLSDPSLRCE